MSLKTHIRGWLIAVPQEPVAPAPARPTHPCGVRDCYIEQIEVTRDERHITVECPDHGCVTTWELQEREAKPLQVIRVQDNWRQHGTSGRT